MALPAQAQVVVIGGGIIGCSTAYHLAKEHKANVVLLEQGKLTSGSTWHAAGLVGQLRSSASITQLLKRSVELYRSLEAETGLATGWKMTGCLRLATTDDRWTEFRRLATTARSFGMDMELLSPAEVKRMWPLLETSDLVGASWLPTDGQASPTDITQSLARGARMHGATILEGVRVTGVEMDGRRILALRTSQGRIAADVVINCGGMWAREIGAMAGVNVPLQPVRHQYIVTEKIAGLAPDVATIRDPDRRTYFKEEVGGLVMGGYEPDPIAWTTSDIPRPFEFQLFDDDWEHFAQHLEQAMARVPAL
ncbi:MAG TPA: FAD-binding oxidoreductase, partial [Hyphomicrobiaceae bacterium]|nr:FAD-binding oxidoreductase [Hyphomicrobiaceae bacterium]